MARKHGRFFGTVFLVGIPIWLWYAAGNPLDMFLSPNQFNTFQFIPNPLIQPVGFLKAIFGNLIGYKKFYILLLGFAPMLFMSFAQKKQQILFFLLIIVLPIELIFLSDLFKGYMFLQRQFFSAMTLFAFFLGWQWDAIILKLNERVAPQTK